MSKRKLLLADDSVTIQKVVNLTFADEGIDVISVGDGNSAMEKFVESAPDLVMVDVNMPGLDGYRICEMIKQDDETKHVPVILLVGSFEPFDENEARRVGANDYLTKPFQSIRQLVNKVTVLLNRNNAQTSPAETEPSAPVVQEKPVAPADLVESSELGDAGMDDEMIQASQIGSLPVSDVSKLGGSEQAAKEPEKTEESDPYKTQNYTVEEFQQFTANQESGFREPDSGEAERSSALDEQMMSQFETESSGETETIELKSDEIQYQGDESEQEFISEDRSVSERGFEFAGDEPIFYSDQTRTTEENEPRFHEGEVSEASQFEPVEAPEPEKVEPVDELFVAEPLGLRDAAPAKAADPEEIEESSGVEPEPEIPVQTDAVRFSPEEYFDFRRSEGSSPIQDDTPATIETEPVELGEQSAETEDEIREAESESLSNNFGQLPEEYVFDESNLEEDTESSAESAFGWEQPEAPPPPEDTFEEAQDESSVSEFNFAAEDIHETHEMPESKPAFLDETEEETIEEPAAAQPEVFAEEKPKPSPEFNALVSGKSKNEAVENVIVSEFARHSISLSSEAVETIAARIAEKISEKIVQQLAADVVTDLADLIVDRMEQRKLE